MKKVIYKTSNLFTLKKYEDSNLCCQSYVYPTTYAIRSAILGQIIQLDGIDKAQELFYKLKNANIYIQFPVIFQRNGIKLKRYSNKYYGLKNVEIIDRDKLVSNNFYTTMGFREYIDIPEIAFYIDNSIKNIDVYLKNIDWIGTSEGLVYLSSVEETNKMDNVLVQWNKVQGQELYDNYDWDVKAKFDNIYMYSDQYKHHHRKIKCCVKEIVI